MKNILPILVTIGVVVISALIGLIFGVNFFKGCLLALIAITIMSAINVLVIFLNHKIKKITDVGSRDAFKKV